MQHTLERTQWLARPPEEVFPFFADPHNLQEITPPSLRFRMGTGTPVAMRVGTLIDYRIRVRGVPMRWRSRITVYDPPHRFVDEQVSGPYGLWVHEHTFAPETIDGVRGTRVNDRVEYELPRWSPGLVSRLVQRALVAPDLDRIFSYRREILERRFAAEQTA